MAGTSRRGADRASRLARAAALGKVCPAGRATQSLEAIIEPGDRVTIEGDNQKQADFLSQALAKVDPARVHDLHMVTHCCRPYLSPQGRGRSRSEAEASGEGSLHALGLAARPLTRIASAMRPDLSPPGRGDQTSPS